MFNTLGNYRYQYLNAFIEIYTQVQKYLYTHSWSSRSGLSYFFISKRDHVFSGETSYLTYYYQKLSAETQQQHFLFYFNEKPCIYSHKINKLCLKDAMHGCWNIKMEVMHEVVLVSWFKIGVHVKIRTGISHRCTNNFNFNFTLSFLCREQNDRLDTETNIVGDKRNLLPLLYTIPSTVTLWPIKRKETNRNNS